MVFLHFWVLGIALDSATECHIQILKCKTVPYLPGDCFKILSRSPVAFRLPPLPRPPPPQPRAQALSGHMPDVNRERQIAVSMSARSKWALLHSLNRATDFSGRWRHRVSTASTRSQWALPDLKCERSRLRPGSTNARENGRIDAK